MAIEIGTYFGFDADGCVISAANFGDGHGHDKREAQNFVRRGSVRTKIVAMDAPERDHLFRKFREQVAPTAPSEGGGHGHES